MVKPHRKLAIFDRDGTITYSRTQGAVYLAWQKVMADSYPKEDFTDTLRSPPSNQEFFQIFGGHPPPDIAEITGKNIRDLIAGRFTAHGYAAKSDLVDKIASQVHRLSLKVFSQAQAEESLCNDEENLAALERRGIQKDYHADVPEDEEDREEWRESVRRFMLPDLTEEEAKEWGAACEKGDFTTAAALHFKQKRQALEKSIAKSKEELRANTVFEPYTMQIGFAPGVLKTLRQLKDTDYALALVTTGRVEENGQYFSAYNRKQFKVALGYAPDEFFDHQEATACRSDAFSSAMGKLQVGRVRAVAIGDDVARIAEHSKLVGIPTVVVNWQKNLNPGSQFGGKEIAKLKKDGVVFLEDMLELPKTLDSLTVGRRR